MKTYHRSASNLGLESGNNRFSKIQTDDFLEIPKFNCLPSPIHGKGLFAGTKIGYNKLICIEILKFKAGAVIKFDGPLRWVNHSSNPNAKLEVRFEEAGFKLNLSLISLCEICTGEEITYDYSLSGHGGNLQKCNCGAEGCTGQFHLRLEFGEDR